MSGNQNERTYIMVRPAGTQRNLIGEIIKRFENRGYRLAALKMVKPNREVSEAHYKDLKAMPFFDGLMHCMLSGPPVVCMVWVGLEAVSTARKMLGSTNPLESDAGTIRGDFCIQTARNIIHGSDSVEAAEREIALWFKPEEIVEWTPCTTPWVYE
jgi:nucleoside-diphosphate kinase